ncbi:MAG: hypothetical protein NVSMB32_05470 [Actinomycetota bacterium]
MSQAMSGSRPATEQTIEGPFYRPGAPVLDPPCTLVRRAGERGAVLVFSGSVAGCDGAPLPAALVDLWHASAQGLYSPGALGAVGGLFDDTQPPFNLRGRLATTPQGTFEVRTIVPGAYRDPPGALSEHSFRPAHLHVKVSHPGFVTLTTQIFFAEDPYLERDPAEVVRPGLVTRLERRADPADLTARGLIRAYFACAFDFVLAPATP